MLIGISLQYVSTYGNPNVGEFKIASSISSLNVSNPTSLSLCNGRNSMLPQVLLFGRMSSQKRMVGFGRNPNGGTSSAPVAKIKMDAKLTGDSSHSTNR